MISSSKDPQEEQETQRGRNNRPAEGPGTPAGQQTLSCGEPTLPAAYPKTKLFDDYPRWSALTGRVLRDAQGSRCGSVGKSGDPIDEVQQLADQHILPWDLARNVFIGRLRLKSAFMLRWVRWRSAEEDLATKKLADYRAICLAAIFTLFALVFLLRAGVNWIIHVESMQESARRSSQHLDYQEVETVAAIHSSQTDKKVPGTTRQPDVVTDYQGRLTKITAKRPEDVLLRYCHLSDECLPGSELQIARGSNRSPGIRFGILRSNDGPMTLMTLTIQRHPVHRTWTAGDGKRPIMLIPEERVRLEVKRVLAGTVERKS